MNNLLLHNILQVHRETSRSSTNIINGWGPEDDQEPGPLHSSKTVSSLTMEEVANTIKENIEVLCREDYFLDTFTLENGDVRIQVRQYGQE